jgi:exodeoxyribonuclease VII large subunit
MPAPGASSRVFTVTQLARRIRDTLDAGFGSVWVSGEISNWKRAMSGHCYFSLKDDESRLDAVLFRTQARALVFQPDDGMQVVVAGRAGLYPASGKLQLYVDAMEPLGLGALQRAFEQLKERLAAEGLFAIERKRPLPRFPRAIGIVTALRGAAIHDMLTTLARRWPLARVLVRPVRVQGDGAAADVAAAIGDLNRVPGVDVLIVGRGGGSLEDLWAFNEEVVARAIVASAVPVVSAVGHEVDFTIADFVADLRAPTPTAAAALVAPDWTDVAAGVGRAEAALRAGLARGAARARERLARLERGLGDPRRRLELVSQRVDELALRVRRAVARRVAWEEREVASRAARLERVGPAAQVARARDRVDAATTRLRRAVDARVHRSRAMVEKAAGRLDALSPLACLARGYAIVRRGDARGPVVQDATVLGTGDALHLAFARGTARARVEGTEP